METTWKTLQGLFPLEADPVCSRRLHEHRRQRTAARVIDDVRQLNFPVVTSLPLTHVRRPGRHLRCTPRDASVRRRP
jgi:hypothetical protein